MGRYHRGIDIFSPFKVSSLWRIWKMMVCSMQFVDLHWFAEVQVGLQGIWSGWKACGLYVTPCAHENYCFNARNRNLRIPLADRPTICLTDSVHQQHVWWEFLAHHAVRPHWLIRCPLPRFWYTRKRTCQDSDQSWSHGTSWIHWQYPWNSRLHMWKVYLTTRQGDTAFWALPS